MKPQIIVVEGKHDEALLKQIYPAIQTVSVNGREISPLTIKFLKEIQSKYEIILFMDPDYAGEQIRVFLTRELGLVSHAFLNKNKAISKNKKKIGIEHANINDIKQALSKTIKPRDNNQSDITYHFLFQVGLIGNTQSEILRDKVSAHFNLGKVNGKLLYQRLNGLGIMKEEVEKFLATSS